jgi:hypothetical protein
VVALLNDSTTSKHSLLFNPVFLFNNSLTESFALAACSQSVTYAVREAKVLRLRTAVGEIAISCLEKRNTPQFRNEEQYLNSNHAFGISALKHQAEGIPSYG